MQVARYVAASGTWTSTSNLDVRIGGNIGRTHEAAVDSLGNVFVIWRGATTLRAARFVVTAGAWAPSVDIPATTAGTARFVFDPMGNATLVWDRLDRISLLSVIASTRWIAAPLAPTIGAVSPSPGTLTVAFSPPPTPEPLFAPTNYAYSLDDGATWTLRDPASAASPLVINGLTDLVPYTLRLVAINRAGPGRASAPVVAMAGPVPGAPRELTAVSIVGNMVSLSWVAPQGGIPPTGYVVEGGLNPGEVLASIPTGGLAPQFTLVAPSGAFYVRIHAVAGTLRSAPSNEIHIVVNLPAPPSAPANLLGLVNGSTVTLSWTNTAAGGATTSLRLNVTGALTTVLPLPMGDAFTYANVPPGTYTLSVTAANASGSSAPSNSVTLTFPGACSGVPDAPTNVQTWKVGSTYSWRGARPRAVPRWRATRCG